MNSILATAVVKENVVDSLSPQLDETSSTHFPGFIESVTCMLAALSRGRQLRNESIVHLSS